MLRKALHAVAGLALVLVADPASAKPPEKPAAKAPAKAAAKVPAEELAKNLAMLRQVLKEQFPKIKPLSKPIQTTADDLVLVGHGGYEFKGETKVPAGVEFWFMGPPGGLLFRDLGTALWKGEKISKLALFSWKTQELSPHKPIIYKAGQKVPNYTLAPLGEATGPTKPKVIQADAPSALDALWPKVSAQLKKGKTTRVFWGGCTALDQPLTNQPFTAHQ